MSIEIRIHADNPTEFLEYARMLGKIAEPTVLGETRKYVWRQVDINGSTTVDPVEAFDAEAEKTDAPTVDEIRAERDRVKAELAKDAKLDEPVRRRGRPPKTDTPMGPDEAAKAVHDHVPDDQKVGEVLPKVTLEFLREELQRVSADHGLPATKALLTKFGVPRIGALDESRWGEFAAAAASWTAESV